MTKFSESTLGIIEFYCDVCVAILLLFVDVIRVLLKVQWKRFQNRQTLTRSGGYDFYLRWTKFLPKKVLKQYIQIQLKYNNGSTIVMYLL